MYQDSDVCSWCGKTFAEHKDVQLPTDPTAKVPCGLTKGGFALKGASPLPTKKEERKMFTFYEALDRIKEGHKVTRLEWGTVDEYCLMQSGFLHIFRNNKFHIWQISDGDMLAEDWILLPASN